MLGSCADEGSTSTYTMDTMDTIDAMDTINAMRKPGKPGVMGKVKKKEKKRLESGRRRRDEGPWDGHERRWGRASFDLVSSFLVGSLRAAVLEGGWRGAGLAAMYIKSTRARPSADGVR